ncbi:polyprenyl synthetase family protein [Candidatus Saccharibacteria bacterium]|nr:polyprenyl synthetase family protein [Candidatus Saccharibacteria bacterium]
MSKPQQQTSDIALFKNKLGEYKHLIDEDIATYSKHIQQTTLQQYGSSARLVTDSYLDILERGGKRIRGSLVMLGYEMSGGKNREMILQAARAIEMIHAYMLIMDDIQDRSLTRRGGPTAPVMLAGYHRKNHLAGDAGHFGIALSLNAMGIGNHAAQMILANLNAPEVLRLNVISILNRSLVVTAHGQTNDIMNEVVATVDEEAVERVLEWKTAHYTFLNPLHVGMVLAGADCQATDAITDYAIHAGKAFQITDDIMGIFGSEFESGKSPMDDMREGKRTVLSVYALEQTKTADKNFLIQMLGNKNLTPAEFERSKDIIIGSGALKYTQERAAMHVEQALSALDNHTKRWTPEGVQFLRGLGQYMLTRTS